MPLVNLDRGAAPALERLYDARFAAPVGGDFTVFTNTTCLATTCDASVMRFLRRSFSVSLSLISVFRFMHTIFEAIRC